MPVVNIFGADKLALRLALDAGARTRAGTLILDFLKRPEREYDIVLLAPGEIFGQMMTKDDPDGEEVQKAKGVYQRYTGTTVLPRPTVFWCPDYEFEYYGDVDGVSMQADGTITTKPLNMLGAGDFYYQYRAAVGMLKVPVVRYTKGLMPPWVVLFHELGHVKQYFQPGENNARAAGQLDTLWRQRLLDTANIEAENLAKHENPICNEIGIGCRMHYKHMGNGMGMVNNAYAVANKAPALRVANSPVERQRMDAELVASVQADAKAPGFLRK